MKNNQGLEGDVVIAVLHLLARTVECAANVVVIDESDITEATSSVSVSEVSMSIGGDVNSPAPQKSMVISEGVLAAFVDISCNENQPDHWDMQECVPFLYALSF